MQLCAETPDVIFMDMVLLLMDGATGTPILRQ